METRKERVLVVDDDDAVRKSHARILERAGFEVEQAVDGLDALGKLALDIDLLVLDGDMPHMDGFEVSRRIRESEDSALLPIIMISGLPGPAEQRRAMEIGINDFVLKPVEPDLLVLRCRWLIGVKRERERVGAHNVALRAAVEQRTDSLRQALEQMTEAQRAAHQAHIDTIHRLTVAAEFKDTDTGHHIERIGLYSYHLGRALGMSPGEAESLRHAAPMHDVGKLGIPDSILLKPGALTEDEWVVMRSHTTLGAELLSGSASPLLELGREIALSHHEHWDGTGYPEGLSRDAIPLSARVCAVVDFFDAVSMDRPYRPALSPDVVMGMMSERSGTHFDPRVLEAFMEHRVDMERIRDGNRGA